MTTLPSGLPEAVADDEDLVRFLTQSNHYTATLVRHTAFLPTPRDQETSVSRHGREPADRLRAIGLVAAGTRTLHAAALFKGHHVREAALSVSADEPPDFHAVVRGWPRADDPKLQKAQQKERAMQLASAAHILMLA